MQCNTPKGAKFLKPLCMILRVEKGLSYKDEEAPSPGAALSLLG